MRDEPLPQELLDQIPPGRFLTVPEIAAFMEIPLRAAYRLVGLAHFRTMRFSPRRIRVLRIDFIHYLQKHRKFWTDRTKEQE